MSEQLKAIVLAAGKGSRFPDGELPKVLQRAGGRPLLEYVLQALSFLPPRDTLLVLGAGAEKVKAAFPGYPCVFQSPQLGTGHAVLCAQGKLEDFPGDVLVCLGDMPLISRETYEALWDTHLREENACTELADTGVYIFKATELWRSLTTLRPNEAGEYDLADAPAWLEKQGERVGKGELRRSEELLGADTPEQLRMLEEILKKWEEIV